MRRALAGILPVVMALSATVATSPQQSAPIYSARAEAVTVPVTVRDKGRPVSGLREGDFQLTDNGVPQHVATASLSTEPIDVTIVLDTSGSVAGQALTQFKTDVQAMSDLLARADRIRLITFADTVSDVFGLQPAGTRLSLDAITGGGITQLYTALSAALVLASGTDRPQLVMGFTDGRDSQSFADADRVTALAPLSSGALYLVLSDSTSSEEMAQRAAAGGVYIFTHGAFAGGPNRSALRAMVQRTGGALYERPPGETLPGIFTKLLGDFRTGYVLTYVPTGVTRSGWHDIKVVPKAASYTIRARDGYDGGQ